MTQVGTQINDFFLFLLCGVSGRVRARPGNENDRAALEDVTALFYNEERNEIYTGNNDGRF